MILIRKTIKKKETLHRRKKTGKETMIKLKFQKAKRREQKHIQERDQDQNHMDLLEEKNKAKN